MPFLSRPDEIKKADLSSLELLDFGKVGLGSVATTTLVMTNTTAIRTSYSIHVQHFIAAKPPTPPDGMYLVALPFLLTYILYLFNNNLYNTGVVSQDKLSNKPLK